MSVKIRLTRLGAKKKPFYRLVAIDSRTQRDGKYIDRLGYYNPMTEPAVINLEKEKINKWLKQGAIPSQTVVNILAREGIVKSGE
ncbi:MAG: 30S ribosomal protein S16 [bacterium]